LALEYEILNLKDKIQKDDHAVMIKRFSKLEMNHLNLQIKYQNLKESIGNIKSQPSRESLEFDLFFELNKKKEHIQEKNNLIRDMKEEISQLKKRPRKADSALDVKALDSRNIELSKNVIALQEQNERFRAENEKVKQHYKELYDSIKITRAKTIEKTSSLVTEIKNFKAQLNGKMVCIPTDIVKPKVLAPGIYAIDVEPLPPCIRNNREAHLDYLKHLKETVETLREIWKASGKLFVRVGHQWKPTGRTFTLGEQCPLTRYQRKHKHEQVSSISISTIVEAPTCDGPMNCRTDSPLVFGLRLLKTYDGESLTAQEFREKVY
ncbi:hypothetical protein Tco_0899796, partial [Tanacetum coccineum]